MSAKTETMLRYFLTFIIGEQMGKCKKTLFELRFLCYNNKSIASG